MPGAHSLDGLMKWTGREEWRDSFSEPLRKGVESLESVVIP